jgi:uncharacterized membrane protein
MNLVYAAIIANLFLIAFCVIGLLIRKEFPGAGIIILVWASVFGAALGASSASTFNQERVQEGSK